MFEFKERRKNIPDEDLLQDVIKAAKGLEQESITMEQYSDRGSFHPSTLVRRFGSWHKVLENCNLPQNRTPMNIPNELLFENMAEVWQLLGRQPSYNDLGKCGSRYSNGTYEKRFGSWNNALKAFIEFINNGENQLPVLKTKPKPTEIFNLTPRNINWRLRAKVLIKDNCICQMCGTSPAKDPDVVLHVDHVRPWSKGGETVEENLRTLCSRCNIGKSDMIIEE